VSSAAQSSPYEAVRILFERLARKEKEGKKTKI
jgi:hypothetical protein